MSYGTDSKLFTGDMNTGGTNESGRLPIHQNRLNLRYIMIISTYHLDYNRRFDQKLDMRHVIMKTQVEQYICSAYRQKCLRHSIIILCIYSDPAQTQQTRGILVAPFY
jgi:hypothetical protein